MSLCLRDSLHVLVELLRVQVPQLEGRVWANRNPPLREQGMPCAVVFVQREDVRILNEGPLEYLVTATFTVEVHVTGGSGGVGEETDDAQDRLLELLELVRQPITRDERLAGFVDRIQWTGTEFGLLEPGGEVYFLAGALNLSAQYRVAAPGPGELTLDPLRSVGVTMDGASEPDHVVDVVDDVRLADGDNG